jgi:hypothetical protein
VPKVSRAEATRQKDARVEMMYDSLTPLTERSAFVSEIVAQWDDARKRFLTIGRRLSQAYEVLGEDEYKAMVSEDLPFGMSIAHQLRAVAEAVRDKRLLETELPQSYATAYQLTTLSEKELRQARQEQIVRSNVLRREVLLFKHKVRYGSGDAEARVRYFKKLTSERNRLLERLRVIEEELADAGGDRVIDGTAVDITDEDAGIDAPVDRDAVAVA